MDDISPRQRKVDLWLSPKSRLENIILDFKEVFCLLSSLSNFVNLALLNNIRIFYDNENKTLYNVHTKEILAYTKR